MKLNRALCFAVLLLLGGHASGQEVQPSATRILQPGEKIAGFHELTGEQPYILQRLSERTYFLAVTTFNTTFYVGDNGVLLLDPMSGGRAKAVLEAIASVTELPVTTMLYTHAHMDHISDAPLVAEAARQGGRSLRVVATDKTAKEIKRHALEVPAPTDIIATPYGEFSFEGLRVEVYTPENFAHSVDTSIYLFKTERVVHITDSFAPDEIPFLMWGNPQDLTAYSDFIKTVLGLDWDFANAGHGNVGDKAAGEYYLQYLEDVTNATLKALDEVQYADFMKPEMHPNAVLLDYAEEGLGGNVRRQLQGKYGHHGDFDRAIEYHVVMVLREVILHAYH